jgi:hypothetical protein
MWGMPSFNTAGEPSRRVTPATQDPVPPAKSNGWPMVRDHRADISAIVAGRADTQAAWWE